MAATIGIKESGRPPALALQIARLQRSPTISILNSPPIINDYRSRSSASGVTTRETYRE